MAGVTLQVYDVSPSVVGFSTVNFDPCVLAPDSYGTPTTPYPEKRSMVINETKLAQH